MDYKIALIIMIIFSPAAWSVSFDCQKASNFVEKEICNSETLYDDDEKLADLYGKARSKSKNTKELKKEQIAWLKERNKCKDWTCIHGYYLERIEELTAYIDGKGKVNYLDNLKLNDNPGLCTGCQAKYMPEIINALRGRIHITGNEQLCSDVLTKRYYYPKVDYRRSLKKQGRSETEISPGTYLIDIDNDGSKERVVEVSMSSGRGEGCDQGYQQVVNADITEIPDYYVNKLLLPNRLPWPDNCRYYSQPFIFRGKTYIENRSARLSAEEIGIDWRHNDGIAPLLSDVYVIEGLESKRLCHYDYDYEKSYP